MNKEALILSCFLYLGEMGNLELKLFTAFDNPTYNFSEKIVSFIHEHSTEPKEDKSKIRTSLDYVLKNIPSALGGYIITLTIDNELVGVSILNKTGMGGIISDYIISHIVIDKKYSNTEEYKQYMLNKTLEISNGNVSILVRKNSPMIDTCVDNGFEFQRLEMVHLKSTGENITGKDMAQQAV